MRRHAFRIPCIFAKTVLTRSLSGRVVSEFPASFWEMGTVLLQNLKTENSAAVQLVADEWRVEPRLVLKWTPEGRALLQREVHPRLPLPVAEIHPQTVQRMDPLAKTHRQVHRQAFHLVYPNCRTRQYQECLLETEGIV